MKIQYIFFLLLQISTALNPKIRDGPLEPRDLRYHCSVHVAFNSPHLQHNIVRPHNQGDEDAAVRMEANEADWVAGMGQPQTEFCFQYGGRWCTHRIGLFEFYTGYAKSDDQLSAIPEYLLYL